MAQANFFETEKAARVWSAQQEAIFAEFATGFENMVVDALAGVGKTTVICEGVQRAPEKKVIVCAFNNRIAKELSVKLTAGNAVAKTLHAVGLQCVLRFWPGIFNADKAKTSVRADAVTEMACGPTAPDDIKKLVSKLHTKGREIAPHARLRADLLPLAIDFECEPDETWANDGFDTDYVCDKALAAMEFAASIKPVATGIDFADMIYLPVRNGWLTKSYDMVVVDEAQDMTIAQLEIAEGICRGRVVVVGDANQAIYGFRGADSDSLNRLRAKLHAKSLPLSTTYRCGKAIVTEAQRLVPEFEAGTGNGEGLITSLPFDKLVEDAEAGNFILSRLNAPLVGVAMSLLRRGKRARVAGRDIGAGLKSLVRKLTTGKAKDSVPAFLAKLEAWRKREETRWMAAKRLDRVDAVNDQAGMLAELSDNVKSTYELNERIEALFTDYGLGSSDVITCSSVHRSKGLEADKVFVLRDTLYPRGRQDREERNIEYVAITRAKAHLVWVNGSK